MAKYSISIEKLDRTMDNNNPMVKALLGYTVEETNDKKAARLLFLALGESAKKNIQGQVTRAFYLDNTSWRHDESLNCFHVARNKVINMHNFLSRKSLGQIWHALKRREMSTEEITQTLFHDVFIMNMQNRRVQKRLCVDLHKNPQDSLDYGTSFKDGHEQPEVNGRVCDRMLENGQKT